jgi:hypothetical protein
MHEQQKLGPNETTHRVGNAYVTHRNGHHGYVHGRVMAPAYGYYDGPAYSYYGGPAYSYAPPAYAYEPAPLHGW